MSRELIVQGISQFKYSNSQQTDLSPHRKLRLAECQGK